MVPRGRDVRGALGLGASALAGLAGVIASLDGDSDIVPFFVGLTFLGGVAAWAAHSPFDGARRRLAQGIALVWLFAAIWVGVLLVVYMTVWQGSTTGPYPAPEESYLGMTATVYHLIGLYGGGALVLLLAFGREGRFGPLLVSDVAPSPGTTSSNEDVLRAAGRSQRASHEPIDEGAPRLR